MTDLLRFEGIEPALEVRSESQREIAVRFMTYGEIGRTAQGLEMFEPGAFAESDPKQIVLRAEHEGPPVGRGVELLDDGISAVLVARVAPTARGDELLTLAKEDYFKGASAMFPPDEGHTSYKYIGRERVAVRKKATAREVSLTWRPTYAGTEVLYARSQNLEDSPVTDTPEPVAQETQPQARGVEVPHDPEALLDMRRRVEQLEARSATPTDIILPALEGNVADSAKVPQRGEWMKGALTIMEGGALNPYEQRALADTISSENPGFVPPFYSSEIIGIIDPMRPFMNSTRRLEMPDNGLSIVFPRIVQRPTVGEQVTQKAEVSSQNVETDTITRNVRTFAGAGDLSLQLLRRSSPSFLNFYLELLAEAYATVTENAAVDALLAASPTAGTGQMDPAEASFGEAFENAVSVGRSLVPDRIWLSTSALVAFINAKTPTGGGGTPMYPSLANIAGVSNSGPGATNFNMTPIWTPALDDEAVDIIIGPSRGFGWAEEGTFTLQADVPGRLGRDVALGGFVVFVDLYPAAFTTYALTS